MGYAHLCLGMQNDTYTAEDVQHAATQQQTAIPHISRYTLHFAIEIITLFAERDHLNKLLDFSE